MPQKGYANLTVKTSTHRMFVTEAEQARWADSSIDNSKFLDMLLDGRGGPAPKCADRKILTRHGGIAEIEKVASVLGVAKQLPKIINTYRRAMAGSASQTREYMAAGAIYIACKEAGTPVALGEIAEATGLDKNHLFSSATAIAMQFSLSISSTDPAFLVRKIADAVNGRGLKYHISKKSIRDSIMLLEKIKESAVVEGRSPKTMAAWALYRSCKHNGDNISQKSISHSANIVDANLRAVTAALATRSPSPSL